MFIKTFKEILAWQKAHKLVLEVYRLAEGYPKHETFGLISQSRRCAVSVPSNIAEGFKRKSQKDSDHFYNIAEGSLEELKYQLLLARDLSHISDKNYGEIINLGEEVGKLLNGWRKSQR